MAAHLLQPVYLGFNPTRHDVRIAELILMGLRLKAMPGHLPPELALSILAHADYHPRIISSRAEELEYHANDFWEPGPQASVAALYLTTQALPSYFRRASRITLQMRSADQGWATFGGDGTYDNSHTWFEACILRPLANTTASEPPGVQQPLEVQMTETFRSPGDANQELEQQGWFIVNRDGKDTWMVHHNSMASCHLQGLIGS